MEKVKTVGEYTIYKKRSGRHSILNAQEQWIRGEEKVKILLEAKLIKLSKAKAKTAEATAAAAEPAPTVEAAPAAEIAVAPAPQAEPKSEEKPE